MPTIHRSVLGSAATTASLPFFLEDPKKYWWLAIVIGLGSLLVIDDVLYHITDGRICFLCKILSE